MNASDVTLFFWGGGGGWWGEGGGSQFMQLLCYSIVSVLVYVNLEKEL